MDHLGLGMRGGGEGWGRGVKVRITDSSEISKGAINWNFTYHASEYSIHIESDKSIELVQHFAYWGSSHRHYVASSHVFNSGLAILLAYRSGEEVGLLLAKIVSTCLRGS